MSKEVIQQNSGLEKKTSIKEAREWAKNGLKAICDPDQILGTLAKQLDQVSNDGMGEKVGKRIEGDMQDIANQVVMTLGLDTHIPLVESVGERYKSLVLETVRQVEMEYKCITPTEKILAQTIASSYVRILEYTKMFNNSKNAEYLSNEKNGYYGLYSKEIDRANRQLISAIQTLKVMKSPTIEMNIRANTAFIAQNQQVNAEKKINEV